MSKYRTAITTEIKYDEVPDEWVEIIYDFNFLDENYIFYAVMHVNHLYDTIIKQYPALNEVINDEFRLERDVVSSNHLCHKRISNCYKWHLIRTPDNKINITLDSLKRSFLDKRIRACVHADELLPILNDKMNRISLSMIKMAVFKNIGL